MNYWIPCWAAMPEEKNGQSEDVLVTVTDGEHKRVTIAWTIDGEWKWILSNQKVVAWMHFPKAWEGNE